MHIRSEIDMPGILFKFALGQQYITPVHPKSIIIIFTECTTFKRYYPSVAITYDRTFEIHTVELYRSAEILIEIHCITILTRSEGWVGYKYTIRIDIFNVQPVTAVAYMHLIQLSVGSIGKTGFTPYPHTCFITWYIQIRNILPVWTVHLISRAICPCISCYILKRRHSRKTGICPVFRTYPDILNASDIGTYMHFDTFIKSRHITVQNIM